MDESSLTLQEAYVALAASSFEAVVNFYRSMLNQAPDPYVPQVYAEFHLPGLNLGIFCPSSSHVQEFNQSEGAGLSLCLEVKNLEAAIAHLMHIGYPPPGPITTASHGREIYAYDPAGNRLILHESPPASPSTSM